MKYVVLIMILILTGCNFTEDVTLNQPLLKETIEDPLVYFCPRDKCEDLLISYIDNSEKSVHCALFDLDLENLLSGQHSLLYYLHPDGFHHNYSDKKR